MLRLAFFFHANLLYAEYPFNKIGEIVEQSYWPVLDSLFSLDNTRVVCNFTGFTLEVLAGEHPELYGGHPRLIRLIREALAQKRLELTGTSWAHTILPTLPLYLQHSDLDLYLQTCKRILNLCPQGFFPPELAVSPYLPELLNLKGYRWCIVDRELLFYSGEGLLNNANDFTKSYLAFTKQLAQAQQAGLFQKLKALRRLRSNLKRHSDYRPRLLEGTNGKTILAFLLDSSWIALALFSFSHFFLFNEKSLIHFIRRAKKRFRGFLFPYSTDIEFLGIGGNTLTDAIPIERLKQFFKLLAAEGIELTLPSGYLTSHHQEGHLQYCKAGSWSTDKDFKLWQADPDNKVLNQIADEAWQAFSSYQGKLDPNTKEEMLKALLLAFNSDGRGWNPLPEHRLFCYNQALKVIRACDK